MLDKRNEGGGYHGTLVFPTPMKLFPVQNCRLWATNPQKAFLLIFHFRKNYFFTGTLYKACRYNDSFVKKFIHLETVAATPTSGFKLAYLAVIDPQGTTVLFILLFVLMFFHSSFPGRGSLFFPYP